MIGNTQVEAFPLVERDLSQLPEGTRKIAGQEVKWQEDTQAYRVTKSHLPEDLPREVVEGIQTAALTSFQVLQLRDYARFDVRITPKNTAYLIEANPNPYLYSRDLHIQGARASGRTHPQTILEIVDLALSRYGTRSQPGVWPASGPPDAGGDPLARKTW